MFKEWPLQKYSENLYRTELNEIRELGYEWDKPHEVVDLFEKEVAEFSGSKYAVAVDCCTHALFLVLKYLNQPQTLKIPEHTYISVPSYIKHADYDVELIKKEWSGVYQIEPLNIWDGAGRWGKGMYMGGYHILSFQMKKRIPIGRGGMILCDDYESYKWFKRACYDGRDLDVPYDKDNINMIGWHYYMTPEDAARGLILMNRIPKETVDTHNNESYPNLKSYNLF